MVHVGKVDDRCAHDGATRRLLVSRTHGVQPLENGQHLRREVMMRRDVDQITIVAVEGGEPSIAQPRGTLHDRVEHGLQIRGRLTDDTEDLGRRRLLPQHLGQRAILLLQDLACRIFPLQALREALVELATLGGSVLRRLAGDREPGFYLRLPGLCPPTHRPLLASQRRYDCVAIEGRLRDRALVGKSEGRVLDGACERTRALDHCLTQFGSEGRMRMRTLVLARRPLRM